MDYSEPLIRASLILIKNLHLSWSINFHGQDQNGKNPVLLGPSLVDHQKLYSSYNCLPQVFGNVNPATINWSTHLVHTQGETVHHSERWMVWKLSCSIRMKRNIERKLRDLGVKSATVTKFVKFLELTLRKGLSHRCWISFIFVRVFKKNIWNLWHLMGWKILHFDKKYSQKNDISNLIVQ